MPNYVQFQTATGGYMVGSRHAPQAEIPETGILRLGQLQSLSCYASEFLQRKQLAGPVSTPLVQRASLCSNTGTDTHFHPEYVEATAAANIH